MNFDTTFIRFLTISKTLLGEIEQILLITKTFKNDGGVIKNEGLQYIQLYRYECTYS